MLGKIEYNRPTTQDRRRRAGFWLALGNFLGSALLIYLACSVVAVLTIIVLIIKLISNVH